MWHSKTLLIAQKELRSWFEHWTAYLIAAGALLLDGLLFNAFAIGTRERYSADVLADFFYFSSGIAMVVAIFIGMKLIAEEKQKRTIQIYFSSPISTRTLIYGKFLAAMVLFVFLHLLSLYLPALVMIRGKITFAQIMVGYAGVILLGAAVLGISIFASCVASTQLIAGVLAAVLTVVFLVFWMLADVVNPPFKDLFSYLAIHSEHFSPFMRGMINSKDVVFYLSIAMFFLELSIFSLEYKRYEG